MGCMACIVSGSSFAVMSSTLFYSDETGCGSILVHGLHLALKLDSKKSHGHCNALANGIHLPAQLCEGLRKGFRTRPVKGNVSPQHICAKWPANSLGFIMNDRHMGNGNHNDAKCTNRIHEWINDFFIRHVSSRRRGSWLSPTSFVLLCYHINI